MKFLNDIDLDGNRVLNAADVCLVGQEGEPVISLLVLHAMVNEQRELLGEVILAFAKKLIAKEAKKAVKKKAPAKKVVKKKTAKKARAK